MFRVDGNHDKSATHVLVSEYGFERRKIREERTIMLVGEIFDDTARDIMEDIYILTAINKNKPIKLIISSPGGELDNGLAIIDSLVYARGLGIKIIGDVYGVAASMAAIILQYSTERVMSSHGWLMNHGVTSFTIGDIKDTRAELVFTQGSMEQFAKQYAVRNTSTDVKYHDVEYWKIAFEEKTPRFINATQAFEMGLVDKIR